MEGSDFVEDYLDGIKLLKIIPTGLMIEDKGWVLSLRYEVEHGEK